MKIKVRENHYSSEHAGTVQEIIEVPGRLPIEMYVHHPPMVLI